MFADSCNSNKIILYNKCKKMKLYAYQISDGSVNNSHPDFTERMIEHWESSKNSVANRIYKRSETDKEELILSYSVIEKKSGMFFGVIVKVAHSRDLPEIPDDFFKRDSFKPSDIQQGESETTRILGTYFFMSDGYHLVTNQRQIGVIAYYCNKFLEIYGKEYKFNHLIAPPPEISLSGIKTITFGGDAAINDGVESEKKNTVKSFGTGFLKLFVQGENLRSIIDSEIVKADLVLTFSKKKMMSSTDSVKKAISAVLGNLNETNDVTIRTQSGNRIDVGKMKMSKNVDVDMQGKMINEEDLCEKMKRYLNEIKEFFV